MVRDVFKTGGWAMSGFFCACALVPAQRQQQSASQLTETGLAPVSGQATPYLIRRLPVSSFPELPAEVQVVLNRRGCLIPQTYEAHHPENVVHARLEQAGSSDWAVLCSVQGTVSLLVFFTNESSLGSGRPVMLASASETERLQPHGPSGILGFNWGIDAATPGEVHEAQAGLEPRPPWLDHDALADSVVDHRTVYHFYAKRAWTLVEMPE
jgi:hypothetical protein